MSDPAILFVKPRAISVKDKRVLQTAGIIVIEIENPQDAKFVRANAEISSTDMLLCATRTIKNSNSDYIRAAFAKAICEAIELAAKKAPLPHPEGIS